MAWPWFALAAAVPAAWLWIYAARRIATLRRELVRVDSLTGRPLDLEADPAPVHVQMPVGSGLQRLRYAGSMVRRWDRLEGRQRRALRLFHATAGLVTLLLLALGLAGLG